MAAASEPLDNALKTIGRGDLGHGLFSDITKTIGRTPIVRLNRMAPPGVDVYVKLEYFNPLSSVKDRLAIAIIEEAERTGELQSGGTVIEATSGNTGIALAMVCAQRGYKFVATMSDAFSVERRVVMRALGAMVVLTPASLGVVGMVKKAEQLAKSHGWILARQFERRCNANYHERTTGPEIARSFKGRTLTHFVTGYGTGGTFAGASRALKRLVPQIQVVLCEPTQAAIVSSGVPQERQEEALTGVVGAPAGAHPAWAPHPVQGWVPNFLPWVCQEGLDELLHDEVMTVDSIDCLNTALDLMRLEGIFSGTSGGGTVWCALEVAKQAPQGSVIVAMVPDTGERYLSTPLFGDVATDMSEAERALADEG